MFDWLFSFFRKPQKDIQGQLICMRQEDTWRWEDNLGKKTPGVCGICKSPIFFEIQNAPIKNKICNRCFQPGSQYLVEAYRDWTLKNDQSN